MRDALQRAWLRHGALAWLLLPLSLLYGAVAALRRAAYRARLLASHTLPVPVIVVGNVVAGGAGKTPVVVALARHLQARGLPVGVVSRGYGRRCGDCREVLPASDSASVGDEPLLIARSSGAAVFVAPRRADAGRALLAAHPRTRVIVADDGLQHLALRRDIEICVFDARGVGNGWLLPAGPLREPWPRPVDFVLQEAGAAMLPGAFGMRRQLAAHAKRADGERVLLASLAGAPLAAVAGIARPQAFFDMLRAQGLALASCQALPDHFDFEGWEPPAHAAVLCTEKDAVKLWPRHPQVLAVPLELAIDERFWAALDARLSSIHGHETA